MDSDLIEVCMAEALTDGGLAVKRPVMHAGEPCSAFFVRFEGRPHGYLNRCPHMGAELDWEGSVFTRDGNMLMCARHGATFLPDTGACCGGPCRSSSLVKLDVIQAPRADGLQAVFWRPSGKTTPA